MLLGRLGRRYGCVACVSGPRRRRRRAGWSASAASPTWARTAPSCSSRARQRPRMVPAFASWEGRVRAFVAERDTRELRLLRVRIEDKGPIVAFHWRGAPDEDAAPSTCSRASPRRPRPPASRSTGAARCSRSGRRCRSTRARRCATWSTRSSARAALYGGDDVTDLDAFDALDALGRRAAASTPRCGWACARTRARRAIVERADLVVDGVAGLRATCSPRSAGAVRFTRLPARRRCCCSAGRPPRWPSSSIAGAARRRHQHARSTSPRSGGAWRRSPGCGSAAGSRRRPGSRGCWPRARTPTRCPSSSRAPSSSTGSGRWSC